MLEILQKNFPKKYIPIDSGYTLRTTPITCDFNYENKSYDKIEIEITLNCNLACKNCNRMIGMIDRGDTNMTVGQIEYFVSEMKNKPHTVKTISIIGGEPLVHPQFLEIWFLLYKKLFEPKIITKMNLFTNGILPVPKELDVCTYNLVKSPFSSKRHYNFYIAPVDVEVEVKRCDIPKRCGITLNKFGYFPCGGGGGALSLLFDLKMAQQSLPPDLSVWDYNNICKLCNHAFKNKPEEDMNTKEIKCSKIFLEKMNSFAGAIPKVDNHPTYPEAKKLF